MVLVGDLTQKVRPICLVPPLVAVSEVLVSLSCYNAHWNGRSERLLPRILPLDAGTYLRRRILRDRGYHRIL